MMDGHFRWNQNAKNRLFGEEADPCDGPVPMMLVDRINRRAMALGIELPYAGVTSVYLDLLHITALLSLRQSCP